MLGGLFSFKGRVDRRRYLLWTVLSLVLPTAAVASATIGDLLLGRGPYPWPAKTAGMALPVLAFLTFLWASLALTAKRLRDIGLPPLLTLLILASAGVVGKLIGFQWLAPAGAAMVAAA